MSQSSTVVRVGYAEHAPPADLVGRVLCVWTRLLPETQEQLTHRVLPDGCADILFELGPRHDSRGGRDTIGASVVGPMTKPIVVEGPQPQLYVGVRLAPGFAYAALGIPASELLDLRVDYALVRADATPDIDDVAMSRSDEQCVAAVFDLVRRRLSRGAAVPRSVREAVRQIVAAEGNVRVAALAGEIGVTRQQLARQFAAHVGLSPKMLARVMRTQAVVARADAARAAYPRNVNWSAIAQELGYYDQPHFIDDFKSLTGSTPGEWIG